MPFLTRPVVPALSITKRPTERLLDARFQNVRARRAGHAGPGHHPHPRQAHAVTATSRLDPALVPSPNRHVVGLGSFLRRRSGPLASAGLVVTWSSGFVGAELGTRAGAAPLT